MVVSYISSTIPAWMDTINNIPRLHWGGKVYTDHMWNVTDV